MNTLNTKTHDNLDPITGASGAHPAGTGIGATSGGIAGAAVGTMAGPVGMIVGATVGVIAGGLVGKAAAESVSPTAAVVEGAEDPALSASFDAAREQAWWRSQFRQETYFLQDLSFDDYAPAYLTGGLGHSRLAGSRYDDIEAQLERDYSANRGSSQLSWAQARPAVRAAWMRRENVLTQAAG